MIRPSYHHLEVCTCRFTFLSINVNDKPTKFLKNGKKTQRNSSLNIVSNYITVLFLLLLLFLIIKISKFHSINIKGIQIYYYYYC